MWQAVISSGFQILAYVAVGILAARVLTGLRAQAVRPGHAGSYRLLEKLGSGGMGEVFKARHIELQRAAAVKMLRLDRCKSDLARRRFEREVQAVCELTHPNTISIYDFGRTAEGRTYYAMEYLAGMDLQRLVERHGALEPARAVWALDQVLGAVAEAHGRGILHRDLKPSNIYLTERGGSFDFVKVLDFGLAKDLEVRLEALPEDDASELPIELELTAGQSADGTLTGTPLYMAPEMYYGDQPIDGRADLYSLGALGYYLLAGRPVFDAHSAVHALIHHVRTEPKPLREIGITVSKELDATLLRALEKDPARRFADAEEFRVSLQATPEWGGWSLAAAKQWWERCLPEFVGAMASEQPELAGASAAA
jgi:serine/threonine-protein kinase